MARRSIFACVVVIFALTGCSTSLSSADRQQLAGKTFVITGASSGFGRGVALKLAANRANVVLAARRTDVLEQVAAEVRSLGGNALVVTTDVGQAAEMVRLGEAAVRQFGTVDVWINNAGIGVVSRFWDAPLEDYSRLVDVNLKSVIYGSHVAMNLFRKQGRGTIVNIGSVDSEVPLAYQAAYSATKAGVLSLGRALIEEIRLARLTNIKVTTVLPWAADTPFFTHTANYTGGTPRMAALDGPEKVVNAIVWASLHPREELSVGWKGKASYASHQLLPNLTERISANIIHRYQIETAPPAPPTAGSLYTPMQEGQGVDGGIRERIEQEDRQRAEKKATGDTPPSPF